MDDILDEKQKARCDEIVSKKDVELVKTVCKMLLGPKFQEAAKEVAEEEKREGGARMKMG